MNRQAQPNGPMNLLDSASAVGSFEAFLDAIRAAGLEALLQQNGPFTLLAPTNSAFEKLTNAGRADLLASNRRARLADTVSNHIIQGRHGVDEIGQWRNARSVNGRRAAITRDGARLSVDGARFTIADVGSSNGVLHGIDTILGGVDPGADEARQRASAAAAKRNWSVPTP